MGGFHEKLDTRFCVFASGRRRLRPGTGASPRFGGAEGSPDTSQCKKDGAEGDRPAGCPGFRGIPPCAENVGKVAGEGGGVIQLGASSAQDTGGYQFQEPADKEGRNKEDWRKIMENARNQEALSQQLVQDLQTRVNQLSNDFYSRDDPAVRDGVIKPAWDKALADLAAAKLRAEEARKRIGDLEEEARKSGAFPGWLR
jgi:hypothetical protein